MSDTVINDSIKYPYIMKPASQPQFQLYKWDMNTFKLPVDFSNASNNNLKGNYQYLQNNKSIGEYLNKGYVCEPDALRVAKPVMERYREVKMPERMTQKPVKAPDIPAEYALNFDVTKNLYNGSAEYLDKCLKGTKLEGKGQMFLDAQEKYGINAVFLMSIVKEESGYGAAPAKERNGVVHKYNIAGLKTGKKVVGHVYQDNESYEACIESLCKNLHKYYISRKKTTIGSIQTVYAPGNTKWAAKVAKSMGEIAKRIMN